MAKLPTFFNKFMKRVISFNGFVTALTVVGTCIGIIDYVEKNGGTFMAIINSKEATPPVKRYALVYLDKDSADLSRLGIFPQITNPSKYSLQDVLLTYKINSYSADVSYTDYYTIHRLAQGEEITNNDKTLYAKTDMPEPFYYFVMKHNGKATINLRATYKGVDEPFTYHAEVYTKKLYVEDKLERKRAVFEDAYQFGSQHKVKIIDLYILDKKDVESFENLSVDLLAKEGLTNTGINNKGKSIEQIETEINALKTSVQEKEGTPWYMFVVLLILYIVLTIAAMAYLFLSISLSQKRILLYLGLLFVTIILSVCSYYTILIESTILPFMSPPANNFWGGVIKMYSIPVSLYLARDCIKKFLKIKVDYWKGFLTCGLWIFLLYIIFSIVNILNI